MQTRCTGILRLIDCVPAPRSTASKYITNKPADSQSILHSTGIAELHSRLGWHFLPGMKGAKMPPGYPGSCLGRLQIRTQPLTQDGCIQHMHDLAMQKRICSRPHKYMALLCNPTLRERLTFLRLQMRLLQSL